MAGWEHQRWTQLVEVDLRAAYLAGRSQTFQGSRLRDGRQEGDGTSAIGNFDRLASRHPP
jgi:hypothetical protein